MRTSKADKASLTLSGSWRPPLGSLEKGEPPGAGAQHLPRAGSQHPEPERGANSKPAGGLWKSPESGRISHVCKACAPPASPAWDGGGGSGEGWPCPRPALDVPLGQAPPCPLLRTQERERAPQGGVPGRWDAFSRALVCVLERHLRFCSRQSFQGCLNSEHLGAGEAVRLQGGGGWLAGSPSKKIRVPSVGVLGYKANPGTHSS